MRIIGFIEDEEVIEEFTRLVVRLPAQGYGTTEFDMSDERRTALVDAGRYASGNYQYNRLTPRGAIPRGLQESQTEHASRIAGRVAKELLGL